FPKEEIAGFYRRPFGENQNVQFSAGACNRPPNRPYRTQPQRCAQRRNTDISRRIEDGRAIGTPERRHRKYVIMNRNELINRILSQKSMLCVGLDSDTEKIPAHLLDEEDPIFAFNKAVVDATAEYCVAYKPNTAFYEARGLSGWQSLER